MYVILGSIMDPESGFYYEAEIFAHEDKKEVEKFLKNYRIPKTSIHNQVRILEEIGRQDVLCGSSLITCLLCQNSFEPPGPDEILNVVFECPNCGAKVWIELDQGDAFESFWSFFEDKGDIRKIEALWSAFVEQDKLKQQKFDEDEYGNKSYIYFLNTSALNAN